MILFCPHCHTRIIPPAMIEKVRGTGRMKVNCGNCNKDGKNNKGAVFIKLKPPEKETTDG